MIFHFSDFINFKRLALNLLAITVVLYLMGCGRDDSGSGSQPQTDYKAENRKSEESLAPAISQAYLSAKDRPECNSDIQAQLIYVIQEKTFYVCSDSWVAIDIKGEQGAKGEQGEAAPMAANIWSDPISGQEWLVSGYGPSTGVSNVCQGVYKTPTDSEVVIASQRGLLLQKGLTDAWGGMVSGGSVVITGYVAASTSAWNTGATSGTRGIVCLKK